MTDVSDDTTPTVDYTATGFRSLRDMMDAYAQEKFAIDAPVAWTDFNANNPGSAIFDIAGIVGEMLTYMVNAYAREQFIPTLVRQQSFINLAKSYDYTPTPASQATVPVVVTSDPAQLPYTLPASSFQISNGDVVVFQPTADTYIDSVTQTVQFIEGKQITQEPLGTSDATQFQRFNLANPSVIKATLQVFVNGVAWTYADNFSDLLATDQAYLLEDNESGLTTVKFGDGINGLVPSNGSSIMATYKVGGGSAGNVAPNALQTVLTPYPGVLSVTNLVKADGGSPAETVAQGQKLLPPSLSAMNRAVAKGDYATLAMQVPGVASAIELNGNLALRQVLLPIAPAGGGMPTTTLKQAVTAYLSPLQMLGTNVLPSDPYYLNLLVSFDLFVDAKSRQDVVESAAAAAVLNLLSFENLDFGVTVREADIYATVNKRKISGCKYIDLSRLSAVSSPRVPYNVFNTGNGTFNSLTVGEDVETRTWLIQFTQTSPYTQFKVIQRITGKCTSVSDTTLNDQSADYATNELAGRTLNPNTNQTQTFTITSNTPTSFAVTNGGMQALAVAGDTYAIDQVEPTVGKVLRTTLSAIAPSAQKRLYVSSTLNYAVGDRVVISDGTNTDVGVIQAISPGLYFDLYANLANTYSQGAFVDSAWVSKDGTLSFALVGGSIPWVTGDNYFIDTYAELADVNPRDFDYPQLLQSNLNIRAIGGLS